MPSDGGGLEDSFLLEVNGVLMGTNTLPSLPERPSDSAKAETWVNYCVALGADRGWLEGTYQVLVGTQSEMVDDDGEAISIEAGVYETAEAQTKKQLQELASSLGG